MTKDEYIKKMNKQEDWAPGWDAIDAEFDSLYPGQEPKHYATNLMDRAIAGGNEYLDGFSIYDMGNGCYHIVTYGMTELYANEEAFGGEYSGFGYEMTMKLKEKTHEDCLWAVDMMLNLARYTYRTGKYFNAQDYVGGNGTPLHIGTESEITGLVIVNDTRAQTIDSLHGKVEFLQLVGVTTQEINAIRADYNNLEKLVERMKSDNPELVTDMNRKKSYL